MDMTSFWAEVDSKIAKFDLLCHPFYIAWTKGELTPADLKMYATEYYRHVEAFPDYLGALESRLPEGKTRLVVEENRRDELGALSADKRPHSDMWLDFAEGVGADPEQVKAHEPMSAVSSLIDKFRTVSKEGSTLEALVSYYAYESQIPRLAKEKAIGLKKLYGAAPTTYKYFSIHATADIEHTRDWRELISEEIAANPEGRQLAVNTAEEVAQSIWQVLDQVESRRMEAKELAN
jgi:pyrroloquinoline-quinone synthase